MPSKRDTRTKDLFNWQPPKVAAGYSDDVTGRGALDNRIARIVSRALRDAKDDGRKRVDVARDISAFLDRSVSSAMLDKWASESSGEHRIPLDAFIALITATEAYDLLGFIPGMFGYVAVPEQYEHIIELQLLEEKEKEIAARKDVLRAEWGARR